MASDPSGTVKADSDVVAYMRTRDRLTSQKKSALSFFAVCVLIPPFQLLLPIAIWMLLKRSRALTRHEKG